MTHLLGTWHPIRAELDGEAAPEIALQRIELILREDVYSVSFAGDVYDGGTFVHTASTLTLTARQGPHAGRVIPAIYQLAGDRLRICYGIGGTEPTAFETMSGSQRYLVTYRRHRAS